MMVIQSRFQHTAPPVGPPVPEPKTFKEMMKHYGKPFVAVYLALCTASFGVIYGGILYTDTSAADIIRKVRSYGIISDMFLDFFDRQCEKHPSLSTAIAAYLLAQCTDPLRSRVRPHATHGASRYVSSNPAEVRGTEEPVIAAQSTSARV
jgi:hypothetical protein